MKSVSHRSWSVVPAAAASLLLAAAAHAQAIHPGYDALKTFARLALPQAVNLYRAGDGSPGPGYWQNRADYELHAHLDPAAHRLEVSEVITYSNNSPTALDDLWLQLDQNMYRADSRSFYGSGFPRSPSQSTAGYEFESVQVGSGAHRYAAEYVVADTRMQIRLAAPLPHGGRLQLAIRYHYQVPGEFGGRTGYGDTRNGEIFDIAQWYPRLAVYDDLRGWDTLPYVASEFYLEYGDFDYYVTVPWDYLVAGSGELQNPQQVLTALQRARLQQARASDRTVIIRGAGEVTDPASRPAHSGELTWHYRMRNTRDVAFGASRAFVWDAARIQLPGSSVLAMSFYPIESGGDDSWGRSTEYLKHAVEGFSRRWLPYPYPVAVNVGGPVSGMEYPGLLFDGGRAPAKVLFWLTAHEIGHTWFPMVVGFDERRDAWMDEGFNTFIDVYESDDFENGVYGPKRDGEYAPGGGNPVDEILPVLNDPQAPPLLTNADQIPEKYRHPVTYFKSALGLILLREQVLGPERFDWAFRRFIRQWAYRHPSPSDFFRSMESGAGEDLSWFWNGWYFHNWTLDFAAEGVEYVNGDPRQGARITIANRDSLVLPVTVQVDFADGTHTRFGLPVETWLQKSRYSARVDSRQAIIAVIVDPDHVLPDNDRGNNVFRPAPPGP